MTDLTYETQKQNAQNKTLSLHPSDNVLVALTDLKVGETITHESTQILLKQNIQAKHKLAIRHLNDNDKVIMYGVVIGKAVKEIKIGEPITTTNIVHDTKTFKVRRSNYQWTQPNTKKWKSANFMGYHRSDGQVGTRNFWLVIPLVFCENRNVEYIKNAFIKQLGYGQPDQYEDLVKQLVHLYQNFGSNALKKVFIEPQNSPDCIQTFKNIDGIKFLYHHGGCGGTREDSENLCKLIAGYLHNPNVAGATILSLGCQHAQIDNLKRAIAENNPAFDKKLLYFEQQNYPSENNLLKKAIIETFYALSEVNEISRRPAGIEKLCIGLKCGGSDGFSGITANPSMGHLSDIITTMGGKTILAEFPELCGVEQELIDRCADINLAKKFSSLMTAYNAKAQAVGSGFSMNPSPGNIKDGLITDAMKSAGAAKKGGSSPIQDVLAYAEYVKKRGLNLLCTPGNDVEATTAMAGSGANLIIFSTGLGTPTGNPVAPVIKTSTNSILNDKLPDLIDFDHGDIITEGKTIQQSAEELLELVIKVASGETSTKAELLQQNDFIPWKQGVSL